MQTVSAVNFQQELRLIELHHHRPAWTCRDACCLTSVLPHHHAWCNIQNVCCYSCKHTQVLALVAQAKPPTATSKKLTSCKPKPVQQAKSNLAGSVSSQWVGTPLMSPFLLKAAKPGGCCAICKITSELHRQSLLSCTASHHDTRAAV